MKVTTTADYCDNHDDGQRPPATHVDVEISVEDSGVRLMDLCDICYDRLLARIKELLPFLREKEEAPPRRGPYATVKRVKCPVTGCNTTSVSRKALGQHMRNIHGESIRNHVVQPV